VSTFHVTSVESPRPLYLGGTTDPWSVGLVRSSAWTGALMWWRLAPGDVLVDDGEEVV